MNTVHRHRSGATRADQGDLPMSTPIPPDQDHAPESPQPDTPPSTETTPGELLNQLRFMQTRLKRQARHAPDEDLARRLTFAKHWIDSAVCRLEMDRALEDEAIGAITTGDGKRVQ